MKEQQTTQREGRVLYEMVETDSDGTVKSSITSVVHKAEPDFVKVYLKDILFLNGITAGLNTVLLAMLRMMDYNNTVVINAAVKRIIAEKTGLKFATVNQGLTTLTKAGIITRLDTGIYRFNPHLFGKGSWNNVREMRMEVVYNLDGKTIKTAISKEDSDE